MNDKKIVHTYETEAEWLEMRKNYITSTESASIMGCGFNTPLEIYEQTVNDYEIKFNNKELLEVGRVLEHPFAEMFGRKFGFEVEANKVFMSKGIMGSSFDYEIIGISEEKDLPDDLKFVLDVLKDGKRVNLEIKYIASEIVWAKDWGNQGIPTKYMIQTQKQMMVGEYDFTIIATVFGGAIHYRVLDADEFTQMLILESDTKFKTEHLDTKTPPPADYAKDLDVLQFQIMNDYTEDGSVTVKKEIINKYFKLDKYIKQYTKMQKLLKAEIFDTSKNIGLYNGYELKKWGSYIRIMKKEYN